jgi:hypothetical protein
MAPISKWNGLTIPTGGAGNPTQIDHTNINVAQTISGTSGTTWTSIYSHTVSGYDYGCLYWLKNDYTVTNISYYYYLQILVDGTVVYNSYTDEPTVGLGIVYPESNGSQYAPIGLANDFTVNLRPIYFNTSLQLKASPYWSTGTRYAWAYGWFQKIS